MNKYKCKCNSLKNDNIENLLNPPLVIISEKVDGKEFRIVRDDNLVGGTKQRMFYDLMNDSPFTEFVYAGPIYGYAQIALAYVAKLLGKKATIFIETKRPRWHLTRYAEEYTPLIIETGYKSKLKKVQQRAEEYVINKKKKKGNKYVTLVPFGLYTPENVDILANQIRKASPEYFFDKTHKLYPKRLWLVAGSATILNALYKILPNTFFNVVQVGKKIWPDQIDPDRTRLYVSDEKFFNKAIVQPPYPTVATYDAKLWKYVLQDGKDGDYIWNVGKDHK